jgi:hypothetical protein
VACPQIKDILPKHGYAFGTMAKVDQDAYDLAKGKYQSHTKDWINQNMPGRVQGGNPSESWLPILGCTEDLYALV